ncbi:MAG: hypothetical protein Kow0059_15500 [Candidatus Sumerlaeia bacterium]
MMIVFIIAALLIIGALGAVEWRVYRRRTASIALQDAGSEASAPGPAPSLFALKAAAGRRLRRRWLGLALLLAELLLFVFYDAFQTHRPGPGTALAYLGVCLLIALLIFLVVVADVRASLTEIIKSQADLDEAHVAQLEREIRRLLADPQARTPGAARPSDDDRT